MTEEADVGRLAFEPAVVAAVRDVLATQWDPDGEIVRAAAVRAGPDPTAPRSLDELTLVVCGILAAGGTKAEVMEFLRQQEEELLGVVRSSGRDRGPVARQAWLLVREGV